MTTAKERRCEFCELAETRPEYADEHRRCRGTETVQPFDARPGEPPLMTTICSCGCGERGRP